MSPSIEEATDTKKQVLSYTIAECLIEKPSEPTRYSQGETSRNSCMEEGNRRVHCFLCRDTALGLTTIP